MAHTWRRPVWLVALLAVGLIAAGCSSGQTANPPTSSAGGSNANTGSGGGTAGSGQLEKEVILAGWGGGWGDMAQKYIIDPFKQGAGVSVKVDFPGSSGDILAKLQAQKASPQMDLVTMTELMTVRAIKAGLVAEIPGGSLKNLPDVWDKAKMDPHGPAILLASVGVAYNPKTVTDPPKSWDDLLDPKYKNRIALPTFGNTSAVTFLLMMNKIHGGDEHNVDPGFQILKQIKPNVKTLYNSDADAQALFERGEVDLAVWYNGPVLAAKKGGVKVDFTVPKEGSPVIRSFINMAKGAPHPNAALRLMDAYITPEAQKAVSENIFYGPVNRKTQIDPQIQSLVPYGEHAIDALINFDWSYVGDKLPVWTPRWDEIMAQ